MDPHAEDAMAGSVSDFGPHSSSGSRGTPIDVDVSGICGAQTQGSTVADSTTVGFRVRSVSMLFVVD
jgi:hypothetical protein